MSSRFDESTVQHRHDNSAYTPIPAYMRDKMIDMLPPHATGLGGLILRWTPSGQGFLVEVVGWQKPKRKHGAIVEVVEWAHLG